MMPDSIEYRSAVQALKGSLNSLHESAQCAHIVRSQPMVVRHFGNIFNPQYLPDLTADDFKSFLSFKNNCHWTNLARTQSMILADLALLRRNLMALVDEGYPIHRRFDQMNTTRGCGPAIISGILLTVFPHTYGVWNGTSEACLKDLNIWPSFPRGKTKGHQYELVNSLLVKLSHDTGTDLWTLDTIFWKRRQDQASR